MSCHLELSILKDCGCYIVIEVSRYFENKKMKGYEVQDDATGVEDLPLSWDDKCYFLGWNDQLLPLILLC